ncbi:MAG TPA: DsbC family protein [Burkholderiales bacterium]|nr:DsbC family protein [Burkholderiales bacterium]
MPIRFRALVACVLLFGASVAGADEARIRAAVEAKFPNAKLQTVRLVPGLGLYELVIDGEIFYSDAQFEFLIDGNVIDVKTMTSLTANRKREVEEEQMRKLAFPFKELPFDYAFKKINGNGARKVAYFADPNCGFCRKFETETLPKVKDVTVYVFMYPVIRAESVPLSRSIWCSADRSKAWDDYVLRGVSPKNAQACNDPVDKLLEFGRQKQIRGTPTLFFADGTRVPGAIRPEQMEELLARAERK